MWAYVLNVVLVAILCHLVHQEWKHQQQSTSGPRLKNNDDDSGHKHDPITGLLDDDQDEIIDFDNIANHEHGLGALIREETKADLESFILSLMEAGIDVPALLGAYLRERRRCGHTFRRYVSMRHPSNKRYNQSKYNRAIRAISIDTFLSTAVQFCRDAQLASYEIISVGCGDGTIEREVIAAYRERFESDLEITLVDPAHEVDYKIVPELIEQRPQVVENCVLLIIWPELPSKNDGYDIDAIRRLRPRAVLTVYELSGATGSPDFLNFLRNDSYKLPPDKFGLNNELTEIILRVREPREENNYGVVDDYEIEEVALEEIFCIQLVGTDIVRMVKLKRIN